MSRSEPVHSSTAVVKAKIAVEIRMVRQWQEEARQRGHFRLAGLLRAVIDELENERESLP